MAIKVIATYSAILLAAVATDSAFASDISLSYALKLANQNRLCSQITGGTLLQRPSHELYPTVEICTFSESAIKTQRGVRLLLAYSFTDGNGRPESHGLYWVDIDCKEMLYRKLDGTYYYASKRTTKPSSSGFIYQLNNGWKVSQHKQSIGQWESLKADFSHKAIINGCAFGY